MQKPQCSSSRRTRRTQTSPVPVAAGWTCRNAARRGGREEPHPQVSRTRTLTTCRNAARRGGREERSARSTARHQHRRRNAARRGGREEPVGGILARRVQTVAAMQLVAEDEKNLVAHHIALHYLEPQCSSSRRTRRTPNAGPRTIPNEERRNAARRGGREELARHHHRQPDQLCRNAARRGGREEPGVQRPERVGQCGEAAMQLVAEDEKNHVIPERLELIDRPQCSSSRRTRRTGRRSWHPHLPGVGRNAARRGGREEPTAPDNTLDGDTCAAMQLVAEDEKNSDAAMSSVGSAISPQCSSSRRTRRTPLRFPPRWPPRRPRNAARRGGREEHREVCDAYNNGATRNAARRGGREEPDQAGSGDGGRGAPAMQLVAEDEKNVKMWTSLRSTPLYPQCSSSRRTRRTSPGGWRVCPMPEPRNAARRGGREEPWAHQTSTAYRPGPAMQLVAEDEKNLGSLFWLGIKWFNPQCSSSRRTRRTIGRVLDAAVMFGVPQCSSSRRTRRTSPPPCPRPGSPTRNAARRGGREEQDELAAMSPDGFAPQCSSSRRTRRTRRHLELVQRSGLDPQCSSSRRTRRTSSVNPLIFTIHDIPAMQLVAEDEKNCSGRRS